MEALHFSVSSKEPIVENPAVFGEGKMGWVSGAIELETHLHELFACEF